MPGRILVTQKERDSFLQCFLKGLEPHEEDGETFILAHLREVFSGPYVGGRFDLFGSLLDERLELVGQGVGFGLDSDRLGLASGALRVRKSQSCSFHPCQHGRRRPRRQEYLADTDGDRLDPHRTKGG